MMMDPLVLVVLFLFGGFVGFSAGRIMAGEAALLHSTEPELLDEIKRRRLAAKLAKQINTDLEREVSV